MKKPKKSRVLSQF